MVVQGLECLALLILTNKLAKEGAVEQAFSSNWKDNEMLLVQFGESWKSEEGKAFVQANCVFDVIQVNESGLTLECCIWFCSIRP
jgi:hypothetical protein